MVDHEAPPPGLYRPKFSHIDPEETGFVVIPDRMKSEFKTKHVELDYLADGKGVPRGKNNIIIKKPECIVMSKDPNMYHRFIMTGECTIE